jgi:hypothetical protein
MNGRSTEQGWSWERVRRENTCTVACRPFQTTGNNSMGLVE